MQIEDILNDDDETDEQVAKFKDYICHKYDVDNFEDFTDRDTLLRERHDYWKEMDRETGWCFLCWQTQSFKENDRFPKYQDMIHFIAASYHRMDRAAFLRCAVDLYIVWFYDLWRGRRGIDKITGEPIPPHWWWPEMVQAHIDHHTLEPRFQLEHLVKSNWRLQLGLEQILKQKDTSTGSVGYNFQALRAYMDLQKLTIPLINKLAVLRGDVETKGL